MQFSDKTKKLINGLHLKKNRTARQLFIVEGVKSILDFYKSGAIFHSLYYTERVENEMNELIHSPSIRSLCIKERELAQISGQKTPSGVIALIHFFNTKPSDLKAGTQPVFILDGIQDPGNLGTIIRTCHWFGASVICVNDCVDMYNPKVVQSTMGSLCKVPVIYAEIGDLDKIITNHDLKIFGADLNGNNISEVKFGPDAAIVLGSESKGISKELQERIQEKVYIPEFDSKNKPDSLNVAVSCSIFLSRIRL
jgi:TrmH family RNA methyltransferase